MTNSNKTIATVTIQQCYARIIFLGTLDWRVSSYTFRLSKRQDLLPVIFENSNWKVLLYVELHLNCLRKWEQRKRNWQPLDKNFTEHFQNPQKINWESQRSVYRWHNLQEIKRNLVRLKKNGLVTTLFQMLATWNHQKWRRERLWKNYSKSVLLSLKSLIPQWIGNHWTKIPRWTCGRTFSSHWKVLISPI